MNQSQKNNNVPFASRNHLLLGLWKVDPNDAMAIVEYGNTTIQFFEDGSLVYDIDMDTHIQRILLKYEIRGNTLITNQPSKPQVVETLFELTDDGKLELSLNSRKSFYVRCN